MLNLQMFVNRDIRAFRQESVTMASDLACQSMQVTHLSYQAVVMLQLCHRIIYYQHNLLCQRELQDLVVVIEQLVIQITCLSFADVVLLRLCLLNPQTIF